MANKGTIKLGSWGGPGGVAWDYNPSSDTAIIEIVVSHGDVVDSVSFKSINHSTGKIVSSGTHDGTGGVHDKISIDGSGERLNLISRTIIDYFGNIVVESLIFHTNKTKYRPYGLTNGSTFKISMENGEIVGVFGNAGAFLNTVGIHVKPSAN
ncbi:hypothetical protein ACOSQ3_032491 [Xanthoceras sorbifolium]